MILDELYAFLEKKDDSEQNLSRKHLFSQIKTGRAFHLTSLNYERDQLSPSDALRIGMLLIASVLVMLVLAGGASATLLKLIDNTGTSIGTDTTNLACGTAHINADTTDYIGLIDTSDCGNSGELSAGNDHNTYKVAFFVYDTTYASDMNVTAYDGTANMERVDYSDTVYIWYELGYYDPAGASDNFVGFFTSTQASTASRNDNQNIALNFNSQYATLPAGMKLAVKVWGNGAGNSEVGFWPNDDSSNWYSSFNVDITSLASPTYNVTITPSSAANNVFYGETTEYTLTISNTGGSGDTYTVAIESETGDTLNFTDPSTLSRSSVYVPAGSTNTTILYVEAKNDYDYIDSQLFTTVNVTSNANNSYTDSTMVTTTITFPQENGTTVTLTPSAQTVAKGGQVIYTVTVQNTGNMPDTIALSLNAVNTSDFNYTLASTSTGSINPGGQYVTTLTVEGESGATAGNSHIQKVIAEGNASDTSNGVTTTVQSGPAKILVVTNRYVIIDDPRTTGANAAGTGFIVPGREWNDNYHGNRTTITIWALALDDNGLPVPYTTVNFTLTNPGGAVDNTTEIITNDKGLANLSIDLDDKNYYGKWQVNANASDATGSYQFIYNWWGCVGGAGCSAHSDHSISFTEVPAAASSPYLGGSDDDPGRFSGNDHEVQCTYCHLSYNGQGSTPTMNTAGVHSSLRCDNTNCHASVTLHSDSTADMVIGSCTYCHTSANTTMKPIIVGTGVSNYSTTSTYHSNPGIPCIICHGPMHNITKPDPSAGTLGPTEDSHCETCHQSQTQHNTNVPCVDCHTEDVHVIKFIQNDNSF
ncbi:MAG: hypothetical protein E4G94_02355, partial [ANME-2 cluster archaeon]